ncbi:hypothetical protein BKA81DRAFT_345933 [Phyllosticta paracitricarpa]
MIHQMPMASTPLPVIGALGVQGAVRPFLQPTAHHHACQKGPIAPSLDLRDRPSKTSPPLAAHLTNEPRQLQPAKHDKHKLNSSSVQRRRVKSTGHLACSCRRV